MNLSMQIYTVLFGQKVGVDPIGNTYYRQKRKNMREKRWVMYKGMDEASKVPPLWHSWLHHLSDQVPEKSYKKYTWQKDHTPNLSGSAKGYHPDGHVFGKGQRPKVGGDYDAWRPE